MSTMQLHRGLALVLPGLLLVSGCATLQQLTALRQVDFGLEGVSGVRLAGVDLAHVSSFRDLSFADGAALVRAVSNGRLPMDLRLELTGENPADNPTEARMVRMDWTLMLEGRETVSGVFTDEVVMPPGTRRPIPLDVSLDLVEFFEGSAEDLVELALAFAGQGGESKEVAVRAMPTVDTALGPIRYPGPITIVKTRLGG